MAKSVIAIVKGGLGNQLFIYAAARALALRTGRNLYLDTKRGYTADGYGRSYKLNRFPIVAEPMPEEWRIAPTLKHPRHKLVRAFSRLLPRAWRGYIAERKKRDERQLTRFTPLADRVTLYGYWQSESYFAEQGDKIRNELAIPAPEHASIRALGGELAESQSVFLHVRRVRYQPLLDAEYYQRAVDEACEVAGESARFVVFGDDPAWALNTLDFHGRLVGASDQAGADEISDLWLMTRCRHGIAANSSFSWWGAWLGGGPSEGRRVWFPERTGLPLRPAAGWRLLPSASTQQP